MKRTRVDETVKEGSGPPPITTGTLYGQQLQNASASLAAYTGCVQPAKVEGNMQSRLLPPAAPVSYGAMPAAASAAPPHSQLRTAQPPMESPMQQQQSQSPNFQRLKVEDALSYLDLVKYKFGSKPQVYNDFLDIMKEFKSQSIDTPGVIQRVSNLFKGFPDLIVGFNTFLPPGYKIEVQRIDQGYAFQVSVSVPSPTGTTNSDQHKSSMILTGTGTINNSGGGQNPLPLATQQQQQAQQHVAVAPQAPAAPPPAPHHAPSSYGSGAPAATYGSLSLSAAQAAVNHALQGHTDTPQNQPVEFDHAINYVNKIKNRFQGQPEKYKRFLEILHTYQKEQRTLKDQTATVSVVGVGVGGGQHLTEKEVYSQVAKLFENQSDLLAEFGQFLPDATSHINQTAPSSDLLANSCVKKAQSKPYHRDLIVPAHKQPGGGIAGGGLVGPGLVPQERKRSPSYPGLLHNRDAPPTKKHKMSLSSCRDVTLSEAGKYGTLNDYAFFDKVRKAVRSPEVYNNFLRCLALFNQEIVSKSELIQIATPFLGKFPELLRWFREFVGQHQNQEVEAVPYAAAVRGAERPQGDSLLEIDLATAKRLGASYCIIPKAQEGLLCSGRSQLDKEVLNDQWVSFPTWSEDSTFVSSRKTQYEEYMYRCEDERFELDVVIETNASTIRVLEGVNKKLNRMSADETSRYKLDDTLGGQSATLHQRALRRIYGDKAADIVDGLKRNPSVAVPVVLRRLKAKEEEWREAQKGFNKVWREQNEKYYLKSLDHQGINFKQTDVKALRSKSLFNEIETIFDERHEQNEEGAEQASGAHLVLPYKDRTILDDASNLLIHHLKRQAGIQKGEKRRIKNLLRQFLPDLFFHPRQPVSDDEREDDDDKDDCDESPGSSPSEAKSGKGSSSPGKSPSRSDDNPETIKNEPEARTEDDLGKVPSSHAQISDPEESYSLFMANNNWYIFLRLHAILCERLAKIYERAVALAEEEARMRVGRKESTAVALRLKPKPQIEVDAYYPAFLDMVKNLLDGNMEANTYEDTLREMFGIHAYIAFTLDKVVSYAVRQLQHCRAHLELGYQRAAEKAVQEENCFKIYVYKKDCRTTIELLDTEPEDQKKVEDSKKWSSYKECYAECGGGGNNVGNAADGGGGGSESKPRCPVYLSRNLRRYKKQQRVNNCATAKEKRYARKKDLLEDDMGGGGGEERGGGGGGAAASELDMYEELERKLNERAPPERNRAENPGGGGYEVADDAQCKFQFGQDSKIMFTFNKDSYIYKMSAFSRARKSHPTVTKLKASRFRAFLKEWAVENVSDAQSRDCAEWFMGRGDGFVPNRTRLHCDNDCARAPYVPYNRYRVERLPTLPSEALPLPP
ncbi:unnamed protein product [Brassicogethes aeneus]|uniref:Paired amphipathic helix protein Sin3a n=1 Tax=Brassicogethes aeneus TaxID=1431903 RepID=A0A9P0ATE2_BRAAE|nr:unnamed protein product [Brassicogethes aeneus]